MEGLCAQGPRGGVYDIWCYQPGWGADLGAGGEKRGGKGGGKGEYLCPDVWLVVLGACHGGVMEGVWWREVRLVLGYVPGTVD